MTAGLWILAAIVTVFIFLPVLIEHRKIVRRQRARKEFRHIIGIKPWWGKR